MLNFCVFVFISYAVAKPAKEILFGSTNKRKHQRYKLRRKPDDIIKLKRYQNTSTYKSKSYRKAA